MFKFSCSLNTLAGRFPYSWTQPTRTKAIAILTLVPCSLPSREVDYKEANPRGLASRIALRAIIKSSHSKARSTHGRRKSSYLAPYNFSNFPFFVGSTHQIHICYYDIQLTTTKLILDRIDKSRNWKSDLQSVKDFKKCRNETCCWIKQYILEKWGKTLLRDSQHWVTFLVILKVMQLYTRNLLILFLENLIYM